MEKPKPLAIKEDIYTKALSQMNEKDQGYIKGSDEAITKTKESVSKKQKAGTLAKTIGLGALTAKMTLGGMDAKAADTAETVTDRENYGIETTYETAAETSDETARYVDFIPDTEKEDIDPGKKKVESTDVVESEIDIESNVTRSFNINVMESFEFEHAKLNADQFAAAEQKIMEELNELPEEIRNDLLLGKKKIKISVSRDAVPVVAGGYDAGRGWVNNLEELARDTAEEIGDVAHAGAKKAGLESVIIEFEIPKGGVDQENPTRYGVISFEDLIENIPAKGFESQEILSDMSSGTLKLMIGDGSESFNKRMGMLYNLAQKHNLVDGPVDFIVASGLGEISEKVKVASQRDVDIQERYLKNENKFSNNEDMVANMIQAAKKMPLVKYEDRIEGKPGVFAVGTDEHITVSVNDLKRLSDAEKARDAKYVLLLENRDTGEVRSLTIEKIRDLLNKHGITSENQKITIDVNKNIIGDANSANILL